MKNVALVLLIAVVFVGSAFSQGWTRSDGARGLVVYKIENWGAFASDSLAVVNTDEIDISGMDSIAIWAKTISSDDTAKVIGGLFFGFTNGTTASDWDSVAVAIDSTGSKLQTLWNPLTTQVTRGAVYAYIKLRGNAGLSTVSSVQNRLDTKVYLYVVGRLRGYEQIK